MELENVKRELAELQKKYCELEEDHRLALYYVGWLGSKIGKIKELGIPAVRKVMRSEIDE